MAASPDIEPVLQPCCMLCGEYFEPDQVARLACGCCYCSGCLEAKFAEMLGDGQQTGGYRNIPRCCFGPMPFSLIRPHLSRGLARSYAAKKLELETRDRTYCSDTTCGKFIASHSIHNNQAFCQRCRAETCSKCKSAWHFGPCAGGEFDQTLRVASENGWKRCPDCRNVVELRVGCRHME